jgi:DnaJ-class molecular chaperone
MDPNYQPLIVAFGALVVIWFFLRPKQKKSQFKLREADRPRRRMVRNPDDLAEARIRPAPLLLTGVSIEGLPHEILGVSPDASPEEIRAAHRELMKHYHPDQVGRPGSREWQDAQEIASAINHAKLEMLKKKKV